MLHAQSNFFLKHFDIDDDGFISFHEYLLIITLLSIPVKARQSSKVLHRHQEEHRELTRTCQKVHCRGMASARHTTLVCCLYVSSAARRHTPLQAAWMRHPGVIGSQPSPRMTAVLHLGPLRRMPRRRLRCWTRMTATPSTRWQFPPLFVALLDSGATGVEQGNLLRLLDSGDGGSHVACQPIVASNS